MTSTTNEQASDDLLERDNMASTLSHSHSDNSSTFLTTYDFVYRIDHRDPYEIFETGFQPREQNNGNATMVSHLNADTKCFISCTSKDPGVIEDHIYNEQSMNDFLKLIKVLADRPPVNVYKIRANSSFFNVRESFTSYLKTATNATEITAIEECQRNYNYQEEILATQIIAPAMIHSAQTWMWDEKGPFVDEYTDNPDYNKDLTTTSNAAPFSNIV